MKQFLLSLYANNEADANAILTFIYEHAAEIQKIAPSFDHDTDWDSVYVEEDES